MILIEATLRDSDEKIIINIGKIESIMSEGEEGCTFYISPESGAIYVHETYEEIKSMIMEGKVI